MGSKQFLSFVKKIIIKRIDVDLMFMMIMNSYYFFMSVKHSPSYSNKHAALCLRGGGGQDGRRHSEKREEYT